jgi:oligopeptide/dipeptide ABC transporter ATP-binding protein
MNRPPPEAEPLLSVEQLTTEFDLRGGLFAPRRRLAAVADVSLELARGRTLGLVGESGCGKSTLARTILRLTPASRGRVRFDGLDWLSLRPRELRRQRRRMQIVFQDPYGSLNPRRTIGATLAEPLAVHGVTRGRRETSRRVAELLAQVGLTASDAEKHPHEFSGGQRQRIGIARALALQPALIVADEPVSALDVSIQAQILNLLSEVQACTGVAYLFISHNLAVVRAVCDDVAVMYLGRIVEQAPCAALFSQPQHPYTRALLAAEGAAGAPLALPVLRGEPPSPLRPPSGCAFHPRCPHAQALCQAERPALRPWPDAQAPRRVACHFAGALPATPGARAAGWRRPD